MELLKSLMGLLRTKPSVKTAKTTTQEVKISGTENKKDLHDIVEKAGMGFISYQVENTTPRKEFFEPILYKNNSTRLERELADLPKKYKNEGLYNLIVELNEYTNRTFKKPVLITMVGRTQAEQDHLYRNSARYQKKKFLSPHQLWHAVDIRSHHFTLSEIKQIEERVNKKYNGSNYYKWTAKYHKVGSGGLHFHIQWVDKNS